jgi:beta-lactamase class A
MDRQRHTFRQGYSPSDPKPKPRRRAKRGIALTAAFVIVVLGSLAAKSLLPSLQAKAHGASLSALQLVKKPAPVNQALIASQINRIIGNSSLEVGVSVIDLTDNQRYDYGLGDTEYIAASTTKLLSASLFLHDVEQGQYNLGQSLDDTTAQTEMQKMIVVSDDDAWVAFNDLLGHPALLQYAQSLGMNSYDPDNNTITSDDLALLLARLYQGKLLDSQHTNLLLGYMAKADYTQYIGSAIPQGTKFYHKVGYLDDRVMDAAIIDNGKHPYVLVIFTKDPSGVSYDQGAGQQAFHDITAATLSAFTH